MGIKRPVQLWYADGGGAPRSHPDVVLSAAGFPPTTQRVSDVEITLGWTVEPLPWVDDIATSGVPVRTVLAGYTLARAINAGLVTALPVRLSAVPRMIRDETPDVAVVAGVPRGDRFAFTSTVGWADVLARVGRNVVVEVDPSAADLGGPLIDGNIVGVLDAPARDITSQVPGTASRPADDVDLRIGSLVASLVSTHVAGTPTLQFGPGGIAEGIVRSLDQPVRIWSGLATDAMAELDERGLLAAPIVAAYAWGGEPLQRLAARGMLELASCTITHDISTLSSIERFVACNTAVQVGLDGSVNVERVGERTIAGVGGHADFGAGASRSTGGMSIIALRSTNATNTSNSSGESTIVPQVDVVSTPRCDVDAVVTEHGVAWLRGLNDRDRAAQLIAIAAPQHRELLTQRSIRDRRAEPASNRH